MFNRLTNLFGGDAKKNAEAYELGRRVASAMSEDANEAADLLLFDRRQNFLSVLDGELAAIKHHPNVSFGEQVLIELKICLESWFERMDTQEQEIRNVVETKWPAEMREGADQMLNVLICNRVKYHYQELCSEGFERASDALAIRSKLAK